MGAAELPSGQFADYGDFLFANGFIGLAAALDSPIAIGDQNTNGAWDSSDVSIFARFDDLTTFSAFADAALFPLESTLTTDVNGRIPGLIGLTFYDDESFTTPYVNDQLLIIGVSREFSTVPEPATMLLFGIGIVGLVGTRLRRKKRKK